MLPAFYRRARATLAGLLLSSLGFAAAAQEYPALFDVSGVAASDVLNIRAEPSAQATILGSLAPDAKGVEAIGLSEDGKWARVSAGEASGWVALRFLTPVPAAPHGLPHPIACYGTEPFWALKLGPQTAEWSSPETPPQALSVTHQAVAPQGYFLTASDAVTDATKQAYYQIMITKEHCSDGMSDRDFGFATRIFHSSQAGNAVLRGCCTLNQH
ncbi:SH3 domain-containing protein [Xinfangfangia sp. CPCC 101601]|uniref:SH3 domain-containing protein n=1 Tax=Pseudogemmobacter lacusdianii TaxID=3069608 RepID=A0ABU0VTQ8_9RHOB|nr:SH3 domain-containing protein [Xinfangfangia sp. CPCC 101601]MDQ2065106.1 SH3 domain-containing protein [Xinfangfangia sp. CPCC 101601]